MGGLTPPVPIVAAHDIASFDSGQEPLDAWLRQQALRGEGRGARTYVVCREQRVVGYYALAAGHVARARAPSSLSRNMPDPIPVFLLGRLAVDRSVQGQGLGRALLKDALRRSLGASREIGARSVLVHAIDDGAVSFYLQYGFKPFPSEPRTLFMPMDQIVDSL